MKCQVSCLKNENFKRNSINGINHVSPSTGYSDISEEGFNEFNPHLYMLQYCVTLKRQILRLNEDDDNKNLNIEEQPDAGYDAREEDEEVNDHKY